MYLLGLILRGWIKQVLFALSSPSLSEWNLHIISLRITWDLGDYAPPLAHRRPVELKSLCVAQCSAYKTPHMHITIDISSLD